MVEIPDEHKAFFAELGGVVQRDEDGMYCVFPSNIIGRGHGVLPSCRNSGAWYVNKAEDIGQLRIATAAAYNVAEYLVREHRAAGCM